MEENKKSGLKDFLKNNLISIVICSLLVSGWVSAGVITRIYQFTGGEKAIATRVNAELDNIVDFINGGNIASNNIAALSVIGTNIKAAAITRDKLSGNYKITAAASAFSGTIAAPLTITGLSTTITTTGRAVSIQLVSGPAGQVCNLVALTGLANSQYAYNYLSFADVSANGSIMLIRDSTTVFWANRVTFAGGSSGSLNYVPCNAVQTVEAVAAGTYTYTAKMGTTTSSSGFGVEVCNCKLVVQEL